MKQKTPLAIAPAQQEVLAPVNLPYQMFLLVQQMTHCFQRILKPYKITPLHWGILCCLWRADGLRTNELATRLEQLGGTITVGLDAMERDGLIKRKKDSFDGRISRIFLTVKGGGLQTRLEPAAAQLIRDIFATLSPEKYLALSEQIAELRKVVAQVPGQVSQGDAPV